MSQLRVWRSQWDDTLFGRRDAQKKQVEDAVFNPQRSNYHNSPVTFNAKVKTFEWGFENGISVGDKDHQPRIKNQSQ